MILLILTTAHLLADFTFQPSSLAVKKELSFKFLILHCSIYFLTFLFVSFAFIEVHFACFVILITAISHFLIDFSRRFLEKKFTGSSAHFTIFIVDQILHLLIIILLYFLFKLNLHGNDFYLSLSDKIGFNTAVAYIFLFVLISSPSSVFIKKLFSFILRDSSSDADNENLKVGNIIGKLERMITVILVLCNQYGVIGLVLTAKSIARFKQMDNKDFAEKYLVGTLTSLSIALLSAITIKTYLQF